MCWFMWTVALQVHPTDVVELKYGKFYGKSNLVIQWGSLQDPTTIRKKRREKYIYQKNLLINKTNTSLYVIIDCLCLKITNAQWNLRLKKNF